MDSKRIDLFTESKLKKIYDKHLFYNMLNTKTLRSVIMALLYHSNGGGLTTSDIQLLCLREYGVRVTTHTVWRVKKILKELGTAVKEDGVPYGQGTCISLTHDFKKVLFKELM